MGNSNETPAQADNVEKERAAARKQLLIDYRMTFSAGHGERVLADLKRRFLYGKSAFRGGGCTVDDVMVQSGCHMVLEHIEGQITQDPNGRAEG